MIQTFSSGLHRNRARSRILKGIGVLRIVQGTSYNALIRTCLLTAELHVASAQWRSFKLLRRELTKYFVITQTV
jgi:hypothetical protein